MTTLNDQEGVVITVTELKQNLGKYMDFIEDQNEVVITKNGKKVARLTPYIRERALDDQYGGKKVSYEEFMAIYEKSTLRMEYINGEIHLLASPSIGHQEILGRLYLIFTAYFPGQKSRVFLTPFDVHFRKKGIKDPDVMQPDLLVACDLEDNVTEKGRYMGTPTLVVEIISEGTRSKDLIDKLNTYCLSGVQEYWIVDQKQENIIVYNFVDFEIEKYRIAKKGEQVESEVFTGLAVDLSRLFTGLLG